MHETDMYKDRQKNVVYSIRINRFIAIPMARLREVHPLRETVNKYYMETMCLIVEELLYGRNRSIGQSYS